MFWFLCLWVIITGKIGVFGGQPIIRGSLPRCNVYPLFS